MCLEINCALKEGHKADLALYQESSLGAVDFSHARENTPVCQAKHIHKHCCSAEVSCQPSLSAVPTARA